MSLQSVTIDTGLFGTHIGVESIHAPRHYTSPSSPASSLVKAISIKSTCLQVATALHN